MEHEKVEETTTHTTTETVEKPDPGDVTVTVEKPGEPKR